MRHPGPVKLTGAQGVGMAPCVHLVQRVTLVVLVGVLWAAPPPPRIAHVDGALVVDVGDAEPGWGLQLVQATEGPGCTGSVLLHQQLIQAGQQRISFPAGGLRPGNYCAVVLSPAGNFTTVWPAEIKDPLGGGSQEGASCSNWSATVTLKGDYNQGTIDAIVEPKGHPGCEQLRVGLWLLTDQAALEGDCVHGITAVDEQLKRPNHSVEVRFESLHVGNYCVRVTPTCHPFQDCLSLTSIVLELPPPVLSGSARTPGEDGRLLWLLLVPLLVVSALVIVVAVCWVQRRAWLSAHGKPTLVMPLGNKPPRQPPGVVRVVYSRDSEAHVVAVVQLCALLQSELGVRVEYDEAATGPAHVTHDWALAMAHLPCPRFNASPDGGKVKMLVLESDGALLKHQAYRQHKDVGLASGSSVDELYHTTYAALLSNQAQALGDYCHILVARLPYTTLPGRLDLVPEKRFLLPEHLSQLMDALLHDGTHQPQQRVAAALRSEACTRFAQALAHACSAHQGEGSCAHLRTLLGQPVV